MSLVYAANEEKKKLKLISLIGKSGGLLKNISDIEITVKVILPPTSKKSYCYLTLYL